MKDLNQLAKLIAKEEGKQQELSIAQIKEVLRIICDFCKMYPIQMMKLLWGMK